MQETIVELMCEDLSQEIDRLRLQFAEVMEVNRRQHEMIMAMCAGKMHPQCPGCKRLRLLVRLWATAYIAGMICMGAAAAFFYWR